MVKPRHADVENVRDFLENDSTFNPEKKSIDEITASLKVPLNIDTALMYANALNHAYTLKKLRKSLLRMYLELDFGEEDESEDEGP